jgi:hypothetical protein
MCSARVFKTVTARKNIECVPHPPYSPDLAPCDFFLFPRLKSELRGQGFDSSTAVLNGSEDDVKKCVPARLPGLADTLGQVHSARSGLLWKRPYQVGLCLTYLVSNKFILTLFWLAYVYAYHFTDIRCNTRCRYTKDSIPV